MAVGVVFNLRPHRVAQKVHVLHISGTEFSHHLFENLPHFAAPRGRQLRRSAAPETAANGIPGMAGVVPDAVKIGAGVLQPIRDDGGVTWCQSAVGISNYKHGYLRINSHAEPPQHWSYSAGE